MRLSRLLAVAMTLLLGAHLVGAAEEGARSLEGEYRSSDGNGPVSATFTPVGNRLWDVAFDFTFNGGRHTYRGSAEGSFREGELRGRVKDEHGRRTFTFRGEYEAGVFRGRHAEVERGREVPTGTFYLEE